MTSSLPTLTHVRQLGTGPYSKVFMVKDETGANTFAAKYLILEGLEEEFQVKLAKHFETRINKASQIHHEGIVSVLGFYNNQQSALMELVEGQNLRRYVLSQGGRLRIEQVLPLLESIASILSAAHKERYLHLNLKPENIFVTADGYIKLADFAFEPAPYLADKPSDSSQWYPPSPYTSPEELNDLPVNYASDVYSLAVITYEILAGFLPFHVNPATLTRQELATAYTRAFPETMTSANKATQAVIIRALSRNNLERFGTVDEFIKHLSHAAKQTKGENLTPAPSPKAPAAPAIKPSLESQIKVISTFGRKGEAMGQFLEMSGINATSNRIMVCDVLARKVQVFSSEYRWLFNLGPQPGQLALSSSAASKTGGLCSSPSDVCTNDHGISFVTDASDHYIRMYDRQGQFIKDIVNESGRDGGLQSVACDLASHLYVSDVDNGVVQVLSSNSGLWIRKIGTKGTQPGQLQYPAGLTLDNEKLYVVDYSLARVSVFAKNGSFLYCWGRKGSQPGEFNVPRDVAVDKGGNVYVCDSLNHRIQVFAQDGGFLYSFGGHGDQVGRFVGPSNLSIHPEKHIMFVADRGNHRIQVFQLPPL